MGRGTIVSGGEDGQYQVKLDFGQSRMAGRILQVQLYIDALDPVIEEMEAFVAEAKIKWEAAKAALDPLVEAYAALLADPRQTAEIKQQREQARRNLVAKTGEVSSDLATYQANKSVLERFKLEREGYRARKAALESVEMERTVTAWCADLTEDAEGDVATLEVPGEPQEVLVAPGGAKPVPFTTGILLKREAMSPAQAYYNAAILPGWQKWRPLYAFATIDAIDPSTDTASITFLATTSSADGLDVTPGDSLDDVPVQYMSCNAGAFEEGDEVVVMFPTQRLESARVIGFRNNPKPCSWVAYYGAWNGAAMYIDAPADGADQYFDGPAGEYVAQWRNGDSGGWITLALTSESAAARRWDATNYPNDGTMLRPGIEVMDGDAGSNAYLFLRPQALRSGSPTIAYTQTGINEFRMFRDGKRLFHYAYLVSSGHTTGQDPNVVSRPFLVGGTAIREPKVDQQPLLPHVDDVIPGWEITP